MKTTAGPIGINQANDLHRLQMQSVGETKETPRTALEQALKRLNQAALSVHRLRDEMVGEIEACQDDGKALLRSSGFLGDVDLAASDINQIADEIEHSVNAVMRRF